MLGADVGSDDVSGTDAAGAAAAAAAAAEDDDDEGVDEVAMNTDDGSTAEDHRPAHDRLTSR